MKEELPEEDILKAIETAREACAQAGVNSDKLVPAIKDIVRKLLNCTSEEASYYYDKYF